ncbi:MULTISPECIES: 2-succinyl-5-enolpyruvyl-6-hydroxy-3-cyclohexene-1-carboxylic-acid synthase [unclassified Microbacterium]|uniref:2-succinyl-5-enolpyruvyl-6-hydroxy-3- cyclohexene-1-carboxylic-acid synthase n=1 Tax=unclassified Microbacterium TaxID=2609290 RepID=UPI00214C3E07|nr:MULTISPECIES: 2-succinyl-5-enolpyruvyl-6-hydroxy-3-cyclohexene-1-carboxylic-acid synthase [unclassified Microbacterium]MCR2783734.1 2-succinyl-5-enolpyruvyl-6-hydroxy-3-cyclohexene-1-carboxylic-acid synthase [Microbacterium sp. zg.B96]WIM15413.1 2-succinyl-5-enolpyruvyl-6-hydroxy-3-cyclohexene-1-carboxylic-acid synthase [Microbacterium sp. zg-B96]
MSAGEQAPATDAAASLLGRLVELGVRHLVLSPGSRSQALALVAAELETRGLVRLHVRIDERVAGFTALGLGRESGAPAAVICTSGTAAANLLPAALEAHHAGVPLLLLTADRPPELRGVGANQTTRQPGMFAACARWEADLPVPDQTDADGSGQQSAMFRSVADEAFAAAIGWGNRPSGPVHLNLPSREPLGGVLPSWLLAAPVAVDADDVPVEELTTDEASGALYQGGGGIGQADVPLEADDQPLLLPAGRRTVVVAGADAGAAAEELAHRASWPLIAEIVSGARFGRNLVHGYRALLRDPQLGGRVERAVVFGHPTLSREVVALLSRDDVEVLAVRGPGEPLNLNGATTAVGAIGVAAAEPDREWLGQWMRASREASVDLTPPAPDADALASAEPAQRLGAIAAEMQAIRAPLDRESLVDAVWRATWPHDRLMFGSSRLVRVADAVLGGKKVPVHANRGLAGIDGTIATAFGIAAASQSGGGAGVTRLLLGDLAFLHDVGALLLPPGEAEPRIQVIVGNDGGGTIFDSLEVAAVASTEAMDRVLYTPQTVRLEQLATAYGWEYQRVTTRAALDQALTAPVGGRQIIEVPLPR